MCNANCVIFGVNNLRPEEITVKRVIEVGALDFNGSLRPIVEKFKPAQYLGVDIENGHGVDEICRVEDLVEKYGKDSFDLVISNELLEHVKDWRVAISNIKNICKPSGVILITTRSQGFPYHAYPIDYWRYELEDMKNIFSDFEILILEKDPQDPGVFIKARKKQEFIEKDLSDYMLYNIITGIHTKNLALKNFYTIRFFCIVGKEKMKKCFKLLFR